MSSTISWDIAKLVAGQHRTFRALDIGGGVGNLVPYFRCYFPAAQLTRLDVSAKSIQIAAVRNQFPPNELRDGA